MARKSREWVSRKIEKLMDEGYPQKQAVAIALRMAGYPRKPKGGGSKRSKGRGR